MSSNLAYPTTSGTFVQLRRKSTAFFAYMQTFWEKKKDDCHFVSIRGFGARFVDGEVECLTKITYNYECNESKQSKRKPQEVRDQPL